MANGFHCKKGQQMSLLQVVSIICRRRGYGIANLLSDSDHSPTMKAQIQCFAGQVNSPMTTSVIKVDNYLAVSVAPPAVSEQLVCWQGLVGVCAPQQARGRPIHLYQHHAHHGFHFQVLPNRLLMLEMEEQADLLFQYSNCHTRVRYPQHSPLQTIEQEYKMKFIRSMDKHR